MTDVETNKQGRAARLGTCEVCAGQAARYACPKCEVKTCCLQCVQIHKRELSCDGIRDRTKYMPLSQMTAREFMSDYSFLEECTRYAENRKRDHIKHYTQQQRMLPVPQHRMRAAAKERGTELRFLLPHFSRRKQNTTYLNWKLQRLYWRVEWVFVNAPAPARFVDERCDEQQTLSALLLKYVSTGREQHKLLGYYQSAGMERLHCLLHAEGVQRSGSRCFALQMEQTLRQNLAGKTIIEFPCIYVSYEQHPAGFDIIGSGAAEQTISEQSTKQKCRKRKADAEEDHDVYDLANFEDEQSGNETDLGSETEAIDTSMEVQVFK